MNGAADEWYRSRATPQRMRTSYILNFRPVGGIGVGSGNTGVLLPPCRKLASLNEAKALQAPPGFSPSVIEAPDGFHTFAFAQWQFTVHQH